MKRGSETADGIPAWTETTTTSTTTKIVGVPIMEPNYKKLKTDIEFEDNKINLLFRNFKYGKD